MLYTGVVHFVLQDGCWGMEVPASHHASLVISSLLFSVCTARTQNSLRATGQNSPSNALLQQLHCQGLRTVYEPLGEFSHSDFPQKLYNMLDCQGSGQPTIHQSNLVIPMLCYSKRTANGSARAHFFLHNSPRNPVFRI